MLHLDNRGNLAKVKTKATVTCSCLTLLLIKRLTDNIPGLWPLSRSESYHSPPSTFDLLLLQPFVEPPITSDPSHLAAAATWDPSAGAWAASVRYEHRGSGSGSAGS